MRGCEPKITSEDVLHAGFLLKEKKVKLCSLSHKGLSHCVHTYLNFISITLFLFIGNVLFKGSCGFHSK